MTKVAVNTLDDRGQKLRAKALPPAHFARGLMLFLSLATGVLADQATGTLDVHWIDSEGGGSTLIVTPQGESVLIDAGNPGGRDAARIVAATQAAGLQRIDFLIITHWHGDHFGGAAEVAQQIPVGTIYQRAIPEGDPNGRAGSTFPLQVRPFREIPARRVPLAPGVVIPLQSGPGTDAPALILRCLAADQKFVEPTPEQRRTRNPLTGTVPGKPVDTSDNANSAVFLLEFGPFRFFAGGDLTWNLEDRLVAPYNLAGVVDVYQTNHHGLEASNNPVLVRSLAPTVVVMNNGPRKGGQPGAFASIRATDTVQALYQLHRSFNIPDTENAPREYIANHEELVGAAAADCPAHTIRMSVARDGRSYTLSVPANQHSRTFQTKGR